MDDVSVQRLWVLRAAYALIAVGLAIMIGPLILDPPQDLEHKRGVVWSLLSAVGLLAALGIRYPLQMLPVLFLELVWKSIWVAAIGLPRWSAGTLTALEQDTWLDCMVSIPLVLLALPWGYVYRNFVKRRGDRWRAGSRPGAPPPSSAHARAL